MSKLRFNITMSLDGFVAGPNQSEENPLGEGGGRLHDWAFALVAFREQHGMEGGEVNASTPVVEESLENIGAEVMGRNKFGGGPGPWGDDPWTGWWGDDPPFHEPVFVLTHHAREPLEMQGGTTFSFVTDGIESALEQAKEAAGGKDVALGGGAERRPAVPGGRADRRDGDQRRPPTARRRRPAVRQPRRRRSRARARPLGRGARRHPPQVPRGQMSRWCASSQATRSSSTCSCSGSLRISW